jgi:hypothetical protein
MEEGPNASPEPTNPGENEQDARLVRKMVLRAERRMRNGQLMAKAVELRIAGASGIEIAKALAINSSFVYRLLRMAWKRSASEYTDAIAIRALESARLDQMQMSLWKQKADPITASAITNIMKRRADMWGIDAPESMRILPPEAPPTDIDVNRLTADEAIYLRNILLRQQAEKNAINVVSEQMVQEQISYEQPRDLPK